MAKFTMSSLIKGRRDAILKKGYYTKPEPKRPMDPLNDKLPVSKRTDENQQLLHSKVE